MPAPTNTPPTTNAVRVISRRINSPSATHDASTLGTIDTTVVIASNCPRAQTVKASMPMKCMDQMPPPSASAPEPRASCRLSAASARRARAAICSASTEASTAMATDNATSPGWCCSHNKGNAGALVIKNWFSMEVHPSSSVRAAGHPPLPAFQGMVTAHQAA